MAAPPAPALAETFAFGDYGAALQFARERLGDPAPFVPPPGERRTRLLLAARLETVRRLGWRWTFRATPDADDVAVLVDVPAERQAMTA